MKIGITYDTKEMYSNKDLDNIHFDFASEGAISQLKDEIEKLGCDVDLIGNHKNLLEKIINKQMDCDLIYNTVEGINSRNRESLVPAILEAGDYNYMGTDSYGLALSLDKAMTKRIAKVVGAKTPEYRVFYDFDFYNRNEICAIISELKFPIIIKPNTEGNSSGIKVYDNAKKAADYILDMKNKYHTSVLCEEFIFGTEITVPLIGNDEKNSIWCLTTVDVLRNSSEWMDLNTKMNIDYKNILFDVPEIIKKQFKNDIFKIYKVIGCRDFARFDYRLSEDNELYFIEVNPLPALYDGGSFSILGSLYGLNYRETLRLLINTAADRLSIPKI